MLFIFRKNSMLHSTYFARMECREEWGTKHLCSSSYKTTFNQHQSIYFMPLCFFFINLFFYDIFLFFIKNYISSCSTTTQPFTHHPQPLLHTSFTATFLFTYIDNSSPSVVFSNAWRFFFVAALASASA